MLWWDSCRPWDYIALHGPHTLSDSCRELWFQWQDPDDNSTDTTELGHPTPHQAPASHCPEPWLVAQAVFVRQSGVIRAVPACTYDICLLIAWSDSFQSCNWRATPWSHPLETISWSWSSPKSASTKKNSSTNTRQMPRWHGTMKSFWHSRYHKWERLVLLALALVLTVYILHNRCSTAFHMDYLSQLFG